MQRHITLIPVRVQRKRIKGWRMPKNTVYVGRGSKWGNPFKLGEHGDAQQCVNKYINYLLPYTHRPPNNTIGDILLSEAVMKTIQSDLRGKNLACWCEEGTVCHADWLLKIANEKPIS